MSARAKAYRGGLPKPDHLGRWRPVVGNMLDGKPVRFQVGTRKTSEADSLRRLEAIRDLYDRQCTELGLGHWANWVHGWAMKMARGIPVVVHASHMALVNSGQAAEEVALIRQLQMWGTPIVFGDELPALGYAHLRQQIDEEVQRAVAAAVDGIRQRWGNGIIEDTEQQTGLPPTCARCNGHPVAAHDGASVSLG